MSNQAEAAEKINPIKFGTFLGVFTPSVLTILGLIMYLRFGWVIGNVGLIWTLVIVLLACSITFITALSASAIATNMTVGVGGEYFMISRSLGLELGGAIGIPLYFCRTLSVTFYCFGMAEALMIFWPEAMGPIPSYAIQLITAAIITLITLLSGKSAALVLKSQIPILILVGLSILALLIGGLSGPLQAPQLNPTYTTAPEGFWYVFAVFFPAVTGFATGIGMSGDLKDPNKSIPIGTISAVLTCLLIYILIPLIMASSGKVSSSELLDASIGTQNWTKIALFGGLFIFPAVIGAILSSAFGSILNAPRVLQALSSDGLGPRYFAKLSKTGQPTIATWATGGIALIAVFLGGLNTIAVLVSVLFLTLYVAINLSAAIEVLVSEPSYRPRIKVPWVISLLGALGAIFVMFLISPIACVVALIIEGAIFYFLKRRTLEQQWGDVGSGMWLSIAKRALLNHSKQKRKLRNWRPQILLFAKDINDRLPLVKLGAAISQSKGVFTISQLVRIDEDVSFEAIEAKRNKMQESIQQSGIEAFCEVNIVTDIKNGIQEIAKAHGIAGMKSNTIMEGWSEDAEGRLKQLNNLRKLAQSGKNILFVRFGKKLIEKKEKKITIWWGGKEQNADLMLLLAYLLSITTAYKAYTIEIISIVSDKNEIKELKEYIENQLPKARIMANVEILVQGQKSPQEIIKERSKNSEIVFIGLRIPEAGKESQVADWSAKISENLNTTIFVYNAGMANAVPKWLSK